MRDARRFHDTIAQPNLFVKVPATHEGVPAIETLIGEGRSINVTLIFGLDRYDEVMEAYLRGLEALVAAGREAELPHVASVASFFVSRVDTEVDRRLEDLAGGRTATPPCSACGGRPRWPRPSRPTSTSTAPSRASAGRRCGPRAPACSDRCGPPPRPRTRRTPTCSTWTTSSGRPPSTPCRTGPCTPSRTTGPCKRTVDADPEGAATVLAQLRDGGIDMEDVEQTLEDEGVHSFAKSFDELLQSLTDKAATF